MPEMTNTSPHAADCPNPKAMPVRMGLAYFCPECNRRLGFVPDREAKTLIVDALKDDCNG
jgi:hypothetical protein